MTLTGTTQIWCTQGKSSLKDIHRKKLQRQDQWRYLSRVINTEIGNSRESDRRARTEQIQQTYFQIAGNTRVVQRHRHFDPTRLSQQLSFLKFQPHSTSLRFTTLYVIRWPIIINKAGRPLTLRSAPSTYAYSASIYTRDRNWKDGRDACCETCSHWPPECEQVRTGQGTDNPQKLQPHGLVQCSVGKVASDHQKHHIRRWVNLHIICASVGVVARL